MNLADRLRKNRFAKAVPEWDGRTKPKSKWTGFKPIAVSIPKVGGCAPCAPPHFPAPRSPGYTRNERYLMARAVEAFERETRGTGKDGRRTQGALKSSGVEIFKAMLWEWLNVKTGALFPSHETIAKATGWSISTVKRGLKALALAGILSWIKRNIGNRRTSNGYRLGQNCLGTSIQNLDSGVEVSPAPTLSLCETRRNIAQRLGAILLS